MELSKEQILNLIRNDPWRMEALSAVAGLELPDWAIGAGFVRNKVWDHLHGNDDGHLSDVDVVFFDSKRKIDERDIEAKLKAVMPDVNWEVVNQATAHDLNDEEPYTSTADAMSKWPETATAVGVTIKDGDLVLVDPLGLDDLVRIIARPTPAFKATAGKRARVQERITQKRWKERWPKLQVFSD